MGTHISLLGNIYSYWSYLGYPLGSTSLPLPISLMDVLNNRLYFRLLCDHPMGMRLMGVYLTGVHLMGVYLMGVHLAGVHLIGVHLTGMCLICQIEQV